VPYLAFLYFLGYEKNQTPKVALFGHQFLLLFVLSTVFIRGKTGNWEQPPALRICVWCGVS